MSTPRKDGGPAFPAGTYCNNFGDEVPMRGMSLRDWFAGQALVATAGKWGSEYNNCDAIARDCWALADAMLEARKDGEP